MLKFLQKLLFATSNIQSDFDLHYGAHCHWKHEVYSKFNVSNIHEVLNAEPSIDHENYYEKKWKRLFEFEFRSNKFLHF